MPIVKPLLPINQGKLDNADLPPTWNIKNYKQSKIASCIETMLILLTKNFISFILLIETIRLGEPEFIRTNYYYYYIVFIQQVQKWAYSSSYVLL